MPRGKSAFHAHITGNKLTEKDGQRRFFTQSNTSFDSVTEALYRQGAQGVQGVKGDIGLTGPQGMQGPQGPQGVQGPQGLKGDIGLTGPQGIQGIQGERGNTFSYLFSSATAGDPASGYFRLSSSRFDTSFSIVVHHQDSAGFDRSHWFQSLNQGSAVTLQITASPLTMYNYTLVGTAAGLSNTVLTVWHNMVPPYIPPANGTAFTISVLPQGGQGETGATGPQGPQGPQGAKGDTGLTGPQGEAGLQGPAGSTGPAGPQGLQGPQGAKGDTGLTGPQGPQGEAGLQGPAGSTGPAGPQGPQGEAGLQGIQGIQGIQGPAGSAGTAATVSAGITTTGAAGTSASVTNSGTSSAAIFDFTIPQGAQGIQGIQGVQGIQGPVGPAGPAGEGNATYVIFPRSSTAYTTTGWFNDSFIHILWSNSSNEIELKLTTARPTIYAISQSSNGGSYPSGTAMLIPQPPNKDDFYFNSGTGSVGFSVSSLSDATVPHYTVSVTFTGSNGADLIYCVVNKNTLP